MALRGDIGEGGARGWKIWPSPLGSGWGWSAWFRGNSRNGHATTEYAAKKAAQVAYSALMNEAAVRNIEGREI